MKKICPSTSFEPLNRDFPAYAYLPGHKPHPTNHPDGHMYGQSRDPIGVILHDSAFVHPLFLRGYDLFNHGYYWEAHEEWEVLWNAIGRSGLAAATIQSLIQICAAAIKFRQGNSMAVERLLARARARIEEVVRSDTKMLWDIEPILEWLKAPALVPEDAIDLSQAVQVVFVRPIPTPRLI